MLVQACTSMYKSEKCANEKLTSYVRISTSSQLKFIEIYFFSSSALNDMLTSLRISPVFTYMFMSTEHVLHLLTIAVAVTDGDNVIWNYGLTFEI